MMNEAYEKIDEQSIMSAKINRAKNDLLKEYLQ